MINITALKAIKLNFIKVLKTKFYSTLWEWPFKYNFLLMVEKYQ